MLRNRRMALCLSLLLLALGLAGCRIRTKTRIVFVNDMGSGLVLKVHATADTLRFQKSSIADGSKSSRTYRTDDIVDSTTTLEGTLTAKSGSTVFSTLDLSTLGLDLTYGRTNVYTVTVTDTVLDVTVDVTDY